MSSEANPIVTVSDGTLMGKRAVTASGTPYYAFQGIPFARPPLQDLRFMAPQPAEPWDGIRDATFERNCCSQAKLIKETLPSSIQEVWETLRSLPTIYRLLRTLYYQSEDCLYLNVLTPELPKSNSGTGGYPVVFWIHGGAFLAGGGGELFGNMDQFLDRGLVAVTINYRLGPFGFLSLDTDNAPGNAGLKDQVQALNWVQKNISNFGGDPNRVTIYGVSAGGASVHLLMLSPMAKGLFQRAIAVSGTGLLDWCFRTDHVHHAIEFAKFLNIEAETREELASKLKRVPAKDIVNAMYKYNLMKSGKNLTASALVFIPTLEKPGSGAFLSELPEKILMDGRQSAVPLIAGVALVEGGVWYINPAQLPWDDLNRNREKFLPPELYNALSEDQRKEVSDEIIQLYCGEKGLCEENEERFLHLFGDISFIIKFLLTCRYHIATSPAPLYVYRFSFAGRLGTSRKVIKDFKFKGPMHGDELGYTVPMALQLVPPICFKPDDPEIKVRERLVGAMASFIRDGIPSFPRNTNVPFSWVRITKEKMDYLDMGEEFKICQDKFGPYLEFWNNLFKKYLNKPIFPGA